MYSLCELHTAIRSQHTTTDRSAISTQSFTGVYINPSAFFSTPTARHLWQLQTSWLLHGPGAENALILACSKTIPAWRGT